MFVVLIGCTFGRQNDQVITIFSALMAGDISK